MSKIHLFYPSNTIQQEWLQGISPANNVVFVSKVGLIIKIDDENKSNGKMLFCYR